VSVGPSRRTDRLTKLSKTKGRLILYTRKVVETAEVRGKGVSGVKGGPKRNQLTHWSSPTPSTGGMEWFKSEGKFYEEVLKRMGIWKCME
jgi:hypothetical protein